jgi:hypothetical protein
VCLVAWTSADVVGVDPQSAVCLVGWSLHTGAVDAKSSIGPDSVRAVTKSIAAHAGRKHAGCSPDTQSKNIFYLFFKSFSLNSQLFYRFNIYILCSLQAKIDHTCYIKFNDFIYYFIWPRYNAGNQTIFVSSLYKLTHVTKQEYLGYIESVSWELGSLHTD